MARQPPLLVLDEPLSMLDTTASVDLVAHLKGVAAAGTAVVVCEHRAEYLRELPGLRCISLAHTCSSSNLPVPEGLHLAPVAPFCLQVSCLSVRLGGRSVLHDVDLALPGGQVVAIVGRNGVGKTTLLRALVGLQRHEGMVTADGAAADLGMVFQNADLQLFNPTVREEILYRLPEPDMPLYAWLIAALGLAAYENTPPLLLSEGEKKRVALATILMRKPRHGVLLDEPTLGQDTAHKAMLVRVARALAASGQLVLITTHDLALAASTDRLLLLGPEGIVADGPPEDVLNDTAPWARLGLVVPAWMRHHAALGGMG
jgi:energy-coupling factor transporter ATP-binding protein EcfA2